MAKSSSVELSPQLALLALSQRHIQKRSGFSVFNSASCSCGLGAGELRSSLLAAEELVASSMRTLAKEGINLRISKLYNDCRCGRIRLAKSPETAGQSTRTCLGARQYLSYGLAKSRTLNL